MKEAKFSGNQSFLKELNLMSSLHIIRSKRLISRAELADTLGLNRSTITAIINQLMEQDLVVEVGIGSSNGGRPPKLLQFNADCAYVICIDWTPEETRMHITDLKGESYYSSAVPYDPKLPAKPQIEQVAALLGKEYARLPAKTHQLLGLVIGVPGIVDRGIIHSYNLGWDEVPLADYFTAIFDCSIIIENSAHIGLTAERHFGAGFGESNLCYIRLNQGIQAGILHHDRIYRGSEGFVGNIGHLVIERQGRKCICGNRGCLQTYASERALLEDYISASGETNATLHTLIQRVRDNDATAVRCVHQFAEDLGTGIGSLINLINPGVMVIDTALTPISGIISQFLIPRINKATLPFPRRNVRILFSSLGEQAMAYGATAILLDRIFAPPQVVSLP